jgi:hypothetical protein
MGEVMALPGPPMSDELVAARRANAAARQARRYLADMDDSAIGLLAEC